MWQPTHIQVTVQRARNLNYKGKNETNDAFVVIALGKDKFQTSIKEKAPSSVEWHEECELAIPSHGNTAVLQLTVYHRNGLGLDEFLGQMQIPLSDFDVYERPRNRWHRLKGKPEKDKKKGEKERGELEIKVSFTVKSGSLLDVSGKKEKNKSLTSIKNLGGSLMSLGSKEKASIKNFAKSVSHKIDKIAQKPGKKKSRKESKDSQGFPNELMQSRQHAGDADPGVISDSDEDFGFDEEVTVNTRSSSPYSTVSHGSSLIQEQPDDRLQFNANSKTFTEPRAPPKPARVGGIVAGVPSITLESPMPPTPPSPSSHSQESPGPQSQNPPLTFPNLTPITLSTNNETLSPQSSASSETARTISLSSSINTKDTNSSLNLESISPEPAPRSTKITQGYEELNAVPKAAPRNKEIIPESPKSQSPSKKEVSLDSPKLSKSLKENVKESFLSLGSPKLGKSLKENVKESFGAPDSPSLLKSSRYLRSTSVNEEFSSSASASPVTDQTLSVPSPKSRSLSTTSTPIHLDQTSFASAPAKEQPKTISALQALASSSSKVLLTEANPSSPSNTPPSTPKKKFPDLTLPTSEAPNDHNGFNVSAPPTPTTPSASVYSFGSSSATPSTPATPKGNNSGPSPATPKSSSSRGTPGLAERPSAAVVRSGSLHEKPTTQPIIDEWEKKLYGRNAMVGSMENVNRSDSRSSLNTSLSSSTQDVTRTDEHGSRFPEIKALGLGKKSREDGDEGEGKKRRGKGGGFKSKLFGNSRERIGEEDSRVVEGGNDRLPHPPTRQSRLPQEIHDKFAGKSREDLLEMIVTLQANMEKNARHTRDLEDYIDGLLLRVMETTPQLLQAPITKKKIKVFSPY
ncbi:rab11 family-interacting protein 1-like isoform X2 [Macrobrachium nipponense]|uniref:rab11 family-interacting protein 1-like isoform X2 n=1 Tax=Macrobrachium nipponense TaxID=159736 RepID=UPI0030C8B77B